MTKLTTMEWNVYNTIKEYTTRNEWVSVTALANKFLTNEREIRKCIEHIRESDEIQKIVLTNYKSGYKLMSSEEETQYLNATKVKILKQFRRFWKDVKRLEKNNQTKITFGKYERDFFESIMPMGNAGVNNAV